MSEIKYKNIPAEPAFGLPVEYMRQTALFTRQSWLFVRERASKEE